MYICEVSFICDNCCNGSTWKSDKKQNTPAKLDCEVYKRKQGWKKIYGKYHICKDCIEKYGLKYFRNLYKNEARK